VTGNITSEMLDVPFGIDIVVRLGAANPPPALTQHAHDLGEFHLNGTTVAKLDMLRNFAPAPAPAVSGSFDHPQKEKSSMPWEDALSYAMWRYETCFYVGDLFEAWSLYQFGLLALELIRESFESQEASEDEGKRFAAREMLASLSAVSSLAWLGTMAFVVVCVGQTACSLLPYFGGQTKSESQELMMGGFQVAGFISSGVALYNVFVVERAFHGHLERSSPLLKFMSVKILVSLSFFQRGVLVALQQGNKILPDIVQKIVGYVPLFGDILNMTEVQLHLFYPALILYECFLTSCMHFWAWRANEDWYMHGSEIEDDERQPLLLKNELSTPEPEQETPALATFHGP